MKQHNNRRPSVKLGLSDIVLRLALILLCLTMVSFHMMGSLFARYSSTAEASDEARVAKFQVDVIGAPDTLTVDSAIGEDGSYILSVQNQSEVAVEYYVTIRPVDSDTDIVVPSMDSIPADLDGTSGWKFAAMYELPPLSGTNNHTLTFDVNWAAFTKDAKDTHQLTRELPFIITVHVQQIN